MRSSMPLYLHAIVPPTICVLDVIKGKSPKAAFKDISIDPYTSISPYTSMDPYINIDLYISIGPYTSMSIKSRCNIRK